ncbi:MAG: beta-propeller fold lactonase family protein [Gammaproteobacteria bacterium]|nr:beta-propeller fold lactonase family protein [Gammaproteobacteria bacterium]
MKCGNGYYNATDCPPPSPTSASLLAVTNATSGTIDMLTIDTRTGVPTPIVGNPLPDGPAASAVAIDPHKRFLYVSSLSGEVRGYVIDPSTLQLYPAMGSPFATSAEAAAIAIDPGGQLVLTANGSANTVSIFEIENTSPCGSCYLQYGTLGEAKDSPHAAGAGPSVIVATTQYVYAVNTSGRSISVYRFDTQNDSGFGSLTAVMGSPFPTAGSPNGLVVDPTGTHVYTTESQPNEVSGFTVDGTSGSLTPISGSPFAASYAIRSPVMDANGMRLHAANGTDVDCFLVDSRTGALSEIGLSYTKGHAIALALDGPDNFLYALDDVDNQVEVFSIDPADGSLTLINGSPFALFPGAGGQSLGANAIAVRH